MINQKPKPSSKPRRLGSLAGWMFGWFGTKKLTPTKKDVQNLDFSSNTQKLGLRFPESLRDFFRFRWLRGR